MSKSVTGTFVGPPVPILDTDTTVDIVLKLVQSQALRSFRVLKADFMMLDYADLVTLEECPVVPGLWEVVEYWGGSGNCRYFWKRPDAIEIDLNDLRDPE